MNTIPFFDGFDLKILNFIYDNIRCPILNSFFSVITHLGDAGIFWILVAVLLLIFKKTRKAGFMMACALILGLIFCNLTLKPIIARIRPYDLMAQNGTVIDILISKAPSDFSFPSGHSVASFEGATVLFMTNKKYGIPALVLAALIAFSRLYLYVHYPTDVIFGVILGVLFGIVAYITVNFLWNKFSKKSEV